MSSTTTLQTTTTHSPTPELIEKFISLLSKSYVGTPLTTAFITEIDGTSNTTPASALSKERLHKHFSLGIPTACRANILLTTTSPNLTAAALIEPPDFCGTPPSQVRKTPGPILSEWRSIAAHLKSTHLVVPDSGPRSWDQPAAPSQSSGGPSEDPYPSNFNKEVDYEIRPFYHLAMLGRDVGADAKEQEDGVKAVMKPMLEMAGKEGVPVWLEASTEKAKGEFETMGFRVAEEVRVGRGRVDESGWPSEGGSGVRCWAMIWEGEGR